mmetsp:Transcript_93081/g.300877  ORF Transcript_93081/g.300877 Transcript_93081/m.300877 type:complete len:106 (-) Transcript_93081:467-784(-)
MTLCVAPKFPIPLRIESIGDRVHDPEDEVQTMTPVFEDAFALTVDGARDRCRSEGLQPRGVVHLPGGSAQRDVNRAFRHLNPGLLLGVFESFAGNLILKAGQTWR